MKRVRQLGEVIDLSHEFSLSLDITETLNLFAELIFKDRGALIERLAER